MTFLFNREYIYMLVVVDTGNTNGICIFEDD